MNRWRAPVVAVLGVAVVVAVVLWALTTTTAPPPPNQPTASPSSPPASSSPAPETSPTSPCTAPATTLRVLTFNIHSARRPTGEPDLENIASEIAAADPDLVLLQEVDRGRSQTDGLDQAEWLGRRLGMAAAYGANQRLRDRFGRSGWIGNAVLSRFPIVSTDNHRLPAPPGLQRRGLQQVRIQIGDQEVTVFNTHLDHTSGSVRIRQAVQITAIVDQVAGPRLLGGDLNAEPDSISLSVLTRSGFQDSWITSGRGPGDTVPGGAPRRRIDYLLFDGSFRPDWARTRRSGVSDHRAVLVTVALTPCG